MCGHSLVSIHKQQVKDSKTMTGGVVYILNVPSVNDMGVIFHSLYSTFWFLVFYALMDGHNHYKFDR